MRPVIKPTLPDSAFAASASAVLMQNFGEYCSVTEEPIPAEHRVWHKISGAEILGPIDPWEWANVLLVSENAFLSQLGKVPQALAYPDDDVTFSLTQPSPFLYKLETVTVVKEVEEGRWDTPTSEELVIVKGTT